MLMAKHKYIPIIKVGDTTQVGVIHVYKFHSIRYGTAKKLSDMNLSLEFIKEMLGHESIQTTMWYVGANRDLLETGRIKANAILNESIKKQECLFQDMCMN